MSTLAATAALVALYSTLSAMAPRSELISRLVKGRSIRLFQKGEVDWEAARRSDLGERDISEQLRLKGVKYPDEVEEAYLERNGAINVIVSGGKY